MHLGTQYYRAPFPRRRYWADDLAKMRDCGLDTVQLWILWSWVESTPGEFRFEDYDELVSLAEKVGLNVVLSTIAEIQPVWIHREIPNCELVSHDGRRVPSVNRGETHFGLTPGGCTDHPEVWERMSGFLATTVRRYAGLKNLVGWDAWNELRWNVQAERMNALTCFCDHTIAAFRSWLDEKHGGLDGLNAAWEHRYVSWEDVQPGRMIQEPYTHGMAFQTFITERANRHGAARYRIMKECDSVHPITLHGGSPCTEVLGDINNFALFKGNDWDFADVLDGVGTSSFPKWGVGIESNWTDFVDRIEAVRSAAQGKQVWLSEVQGGRASHGFTIYDPVEPADQQSWIWIGQSCGADVLLFWCWRDEIFGRESNGFGMSGADGFADERMKAMARTAEVMRNNSGLLNAYKPDDPKVGVWFSPQAYYLTWLEESTARRAREGMEAWQAAFTRASVAYRLIEENHLDDLAGLELLVLPRALVLDSKAEQALEAWARAGGTLFCESEAGAFNSIGLYRYTHDRWLGVLTGALETGRRRLKSFRFRASLPGQGDFDLQGVQWFTPMKAAGEVWASDDSGALMQQVPVGSGKIVLCSTFLGKAPEDQPDDFARFVNALVDYAGVARRGEFLNSSTDAKNFPYFRYGRSEGRDVLFCFAKPGTSHVQLRLGPGVFDGRDELTDLISGQAITVSGERVVDFAAGEWGVSVWV